MKIVLDPGHPLQDRLRPGFSAVVTIHASGKHAAQGGLSVLSTPPSSPTSPPASPAASAAPPTARGVITTRPLIGVFGVLFGALIATCAGRLLSVGLADSRGALHLGVDEASWLNTAFNAALMFIGPFSVYLGGLLGARRVLWRALQSLQ